MPHRNRNSTAPGYPPQNGATSPPIASHAAPSGPPALRQAGNWLACGWRAVAQEKSLWFGMSIIYVVLGFLLTRIPFMGHLLLILITPMLLAGVFWGRAPENRDAVVADPAPASQVQALIQTWLLQPIQELMRIFHREEKIFGAVLLGIVTLGLVVAVKIVGYLLIGGSMVTGLTAGRGYITTFATLFGMLLVAGLSVLLAMGLLYSVPLTVLGNRQPLNAIAESFATCRENARTLLILALPFFLLYLAIVIAFANATWLGYLVLLTLGVVVLPWMVAVVYCSYGSLYPPQVFEKPSHST